MDEDEQLHQERREVERELSELGSPDEWPPGHANWERYTKLQRRREDVVKGLRHLHARPERP